MIDFAKLLERPASPADGDSHETHDLGVSFATGPRSLTQVPVTNLDISPENRIAVLTEPYGPGADRLRFLRMKLREMKARSGLRSLVITSALPRDGKSTLTMNLATALVEDGKRNVLVIEADLHHPTIAQNLGTHARPGLAECLETSTDAFPSLRRLDPVGWYLLHAGNPTGNPTELLQGDPPAEITEGLFPFFDWILIDSPPVTPLTDALSLLTWVDAALLVVRADETPRSAVEEALENLGRENTAAVVFNGAESVNRQYSKFYGYYGKKRQSAVPGISSNQPHGARKAGE